MYNKSSIVGRSFVRDAVGKPPRFNWQWSPGKKFQVAIFLCLQVLILPGCQRTEPNSTTNPSSLTGSAPKDQITINEQRIEPDVTLPNSMALSLDSNTSTIELDRKISNSEFRSICELENLETLILDGGGVTVKDIELIARLPKLEHLRIRNCPIDNKGVRQLSRNSKLRIFNFPQATFGNEALEILATFPRLELLRFSSPNVDNKGIRHLKKSKSLRALHLIRVPIDNDAVASLCEISELESLYLDGTGMDDKGFSEILRLRPGIHLHVDQVHLDYDPNRHDHTK